MSYGEEYVPSVAQVKLIAELCEPSARHGRSCSLRDLATLRPEYRLRNRMSASQSVSGQPVATSLSLPVDQGVVPVAVDISWMCAIFASIMLAGDQTQALLPDRRSRIHHALGQRPNESRYRE